MAASTLLSMRSQQQQGQAAAQAGEYNARVAAYEAQTQRTLAGAEIQKGAEESGRLMRTGRARQGEMAAGMGASGFALDSGSNLGLLGQSAEEIQQDASIVRQNANMAAWGHLAAANRAENEGAFALYSGQQGLANSKLAMTGTLLGGISKGLGAYYGMTG
jgi:hypothetical protein